MRTETLFTYEAAVRGVIEQILDHREGPLRLTEIADLGFESRYFTRCYDNPDEVPPQETRYDLCFTVPPDFVPFEGLTLGELPEGEYAVFVHQGPDDLIVDTWARAFMEWLPQSGRTFDGVTFEEYVNGFYLRPELPDEKLIVTAVYLKLA